MDAIDLTPRVKGGQLAEQEAAIIALIKSGSGATKFRSTISISAEIALAAVRAADVVHRDFSNFIAVTLEEQSKRYAAPSPEESAFLAKVALALAERPAIKAEVEKVLSKVGREFRRTAA